MIIKRHNFKNLNFKLLQLLQLFSHLLMSSSDINIGEICRLLEGTR